MRLSGPERGHCGLHANQTIIPWAAGCRSFPPCPRALWPRHLARLAPRRACLATARPQPQPRSWPYRRQPVRRQRVPWPAAAVPEPAGKLQQRQHRRRELKSSISVSPFWLVVHVRDRFGLRRRQQLRCRSEGAGRHQRTRRAQIALTKRPQGRSPGQPALEIRHRGRDDALNASGNRRQAPGAG